MWFDMWDGLSRFTSEWDFCAAVSLHLFTFYVCVRTSTHLCGFVAGGQSDWWIGKSGWGIKNQCLITLINGQIRRRDAETVVIKRRGEEDERKTRGRWEERTRNKRKGKEGEGKEEEEKRTRRDDVLSGGPWDCVSEVSDHRLKRFMYSYPHFVEDTLTSLPLTPSPCSSSPVHPPALSLLSVSISRL